MAEEKKAYAPDKGESNIVKNKIKVKAKNTPEDCDPSEDISNMPNGDTPGKHLGS